MPPPPRPPGPAGPVRRAPARRVAGAGGVLLAVLVGGVVAAVAYWATMGSGSASPASGTTAPLSLTAGAPAASLYPGATAPVRVAVNNPGAAEVWVGSLALDATQGSSGFAVDAAHPDCDESVLAYTTQTNGGAGWTLPAGGSLDLTLADALSMSLDADAGCQGATFVVYLRVTG